MSIMFKETGGNGARVKRVGEGVQHEAQRQPAGRPSSGNPKYEKKATVLQSRVFCVLRSSLRSVRWAALHGQQGSRQKPPHCLYSPYLTALIRNEINDMSG